MKSNNTPGQNGYSSDPGEDWHSLVALIPDENVILTNRAARFHQLGRGGDLGLLILTNKRLMGLKYARGAHAGYEQVLFQIDLTCIDLFQIYKQTGFFWGTPLLGVRSKPRIYPEGQAPYGAYDVEIELAFDPNENDLNDLYKELSNAIMISKEPKPIKEEIVQYNISTSFQFGADGGLIVKCPSCGAASPLQTKTNPVKCKYCNNEYVIPKKLLELI